MLIHEMRKKKMRSLKKMYIMLRSKIKKKKIPDITISATNASLKC